MNTMNYLKRSFLNAAGVLVYVSALVMLMSHAKVIFGEKDTFLIPIFMLLLFIISATVTGLLVLGKPIALYMSGAKKEAITLLLITLAWLSIFLILVAFGMVLIRT